MIALSFCKHKTTFFVVICCFLPLLFFCIKKNAIIIFKGVEKMKKFQRLNEIMKQLQSFKQVSVKELSLRFNVSEETIRRDFEQLEREGIIKRAHGGASLSKKIDAPYSYRSTVNQSQKQIISQNVFEILKNQHSIMADSSSTVLEALRLLSSQNTSYTVITNGIHTLYELSSTQLNFISTGGDLKSDSGTLVGAQAIETINNYYTDVTLLSCSSMTPNGFSVANKAEGLTKKAMIEHGKINVMLVDSSKFSEHNDSLFKFADYSNIDYFITEKDIPNYLMEALVRYEIKVIISTNHFKHD